MRSHQKSSELLCPIELASNEILSPQLPINQKLPYQPPINESLPSQLTVNQNIPRHLPIKENVPSQLQTIKRPPFQLPIKENQPSELPIKEEPNISESSIQVKQNDEGNPRSWSYKTYNKLYLKIPEILRVTPTTFIIIQHNNNLSKLRFASRFEWRLLLVKSFVQTLETVHSSRCFLLRNFQTGIVTQPHSQPPRSTSAGNEHAASSAQLRRELVDGVRQIAVCF